MMTLDNVLEQLVSAQIIRRLNEKVYAPESPDVTYWFKHTLTQETAFNSLLVSQRRRIHRAIAEAIEELYPDQVDENAALLAEHYAQAGDDAKTFEYALMAGDVAARVYANAEALSAYDRALRAAKHSPLIVNSASLCHLYLKRGRVLEVTNQSYAALANYEEMENVAHERGDPELELQALMARSTLHSVPGPGQDPLLARGLSTQALALAQELENRPAEAKIYWNLMLLENWGNGNPRNSVEFGEKSLSIAREFNLREQWAYTLHDLSMAYLSVGRDEEAWAALQSGIEMFRALDNKTALAEGVLRAAMMDFMQGGFEQASGLSQQGLEIATSINDQLSWTLALFILCHVHRESGEPEKMIDYATQCIEISKKARIGPMVLGVYALLAWALGTLGQIERGLERVQMGFLASRSIATGTLHVDPWYAILQSTWIHLELLRGNTGKANDIAAEASLVPRTEFITIQSVDNHIEFLATGELAFARGDYAETVQVMEQLIAVLTQLHIRPYRAHALYLKGKALLALGNQECAAEVWNEARAEAEAMGSRSILWQVLADLSKLEEVRGRPAQADELRAQSREAIEYIAQHSPDDLRASFLGLPDVRAILA